jgi:hypothetical protein
VTRLVALENSVPTSVSLTLRRHGVSPGPGGSPGGGGGLKNNSELDSEAQPLLLRSMHTVRFNVLVPAILFPILASSYGALQGASGIYPGNQVTKLAPFSVLRISGGMAARKVVKIDIVSDTI